MQAASTTQKCDGRRVVYTPIYAAADEPGGHASARGSNERLFLSNASARKV